MNVITKTLQLADGRTITIETGKVAKQTDGSVVLRMNNTVLLATVCAAKDAVPGTDFMPLQVDYREQYSAAGRFPGGFTKREGKAGDNEILTSRLVDRVLRPLFPSNYHAEVFVNVMLLSADGVDQPDALAGFAASAALACSDIPFECPISEVRVARVNGEYVINPTFEQMKEADMDIMVGASAENIMMVEGEMQEGMVWEAAMAAANYKLDNFTVFVDNNGLQISGKNDEVMALGDIAAKFRAFGFDVIEVEDGNDIEQVLAAINVPFTPGKPKCILAHTVKGKGVSFMENNVGWHGTAPKPDQRDAALKELEG